MPMPPKQGENHTDFMGRCMSYMAENEPDMKQEQRVAICMSYWRKSHPEEMHEAGEGKRR